MTTVVVLFNLQAGADPLAYERWARDTDVPIVRSLPSVKQYTVLKASALMRGGAAPYQYVELIELHSLDGLRSDAASEIMQSVSKQFREFADAPLFIVTDALS